MRVKIHLYQWFAVNTRGVFSSEKRCYRHCCLRATAGTRAARASAKFDSPMSVYQYKKIWWSMLARPAILARWSHQLPSSKYWINFESNLYTSTAPGACIGRWCDRSVRIRGRGRCKQRVVQSYIDHYTALLHQTSTRGSGGSQAWCMQHQPTSGVKLRTTTKNASGAASSLLNLFFCFLSSFLFFSTTTIIILFFSILFCSFFFPILFHSVLFFSFLFCSVLSFTLGVFYQSPQFFSSFSQIKTLFLYC